MLLAEPKPQTVLEVGTWLGGGSTLHLLRALEQNKTGHLWGIEADRTIYARMLENIREAAPEGLPRFTPLFGFSTEVIPRWLEQLGPEPRVDLVFLDGGDNPVEQIQEFQLLDPYIPVGGQLFAHDANLRKGKWLRPYLTSLDHWKVELHQVSVEGLLRAAKVASRASPASALAAKARLRSLSREPIEVIGRLLPTSVLDRLLPLLPGKLRRRITQGR